jgi:hypothetical protein
MATISPTFARRQAAHARSFAAMLHKSRQEFLKHGEAVFGRATGFALLANLALFPDRFPPSARTITRAYAYRFWRPANAGEWIDIIVAALLWPLAVVASIVWLTCRHGGVVRDQFGRSRIQQCGDQFRLAFTSGLLPPWYYVFELYRPGELKKGRAFLTRGGTKHSSMKMLARARGSASPLDDKEAFARFCAKRQLRTLPVLFSVHGGELRGTVGADWAFEADLFLKPVCGRGGKGAERWDYRGNGAYRSVGGQRLSAPELIDRVRELSRFQPYLVQGRAKNHHALRDLSNDALSTVRILTALNEEDRPEIIGAVLKMAVSNNVTTDNVHAGAIAAPIDIEHGRLGQATYSGFDPRKGWIDRHPESGALITGRTLPVWDELCDLALKAHSAFGDWMVVGWDIAILEDGPTLVEGNCGADIDLVQRPLRTAFGSSRLGELMAFHLDRTEHIWRA